MCLQYMSYTGIMSFATRLFGPEGCSGSRRDDGGQPALQFGDSGPGPRRPTVLRGRSGLATAEVLHPRAQGSPTDRVNGDKDENTSDTGDMRVPTI